ncbi:MAG: type II toxin-antitoxin system HicB family antitoxin [Hyphomicrobium sp.]
MDYIAVVFAEKGSAFGAYFPDLPGCFSAADSWNDVRSNAQEALALYARDEAALPKPRSPDELMHDGEVRREVAAGATLLAVPLIVSRRKERYNLMLDPALVEAVDTAARIAGISRSEFVETAAAATLAGRTLPTRKTAQRRKTSAK